MFCVVGDGEAETGPLAASWHSNKFTNAATDGAVLPILHLNGYKIANPRILARIPESELIGLFEGYGYRPTIIAGDDPALVHQLMAAALDRALDEIRDIQRAAREHGDDRRPQWPMHPEGLDRAKGGRRPARLGKLQLAPGPVCRRPQQPRPPGPARRLAAELLARRAVRRGRPASPGVEGPCASWRAAHERQPAGERRPPAAGPVAARPPADPRRQRGPGTLGDAGAAVGSSGQTSSSR